VRDSYAALMAHRRDSFDLGRLVVPDQIEPVVGWRTWSATTGPGPGSWQLESPAYSQAWPAGNPAQARCRRDEDDPASARRAHRAPDERCRCGIYGAHEPDLACGFLSFLYTPAHERIEVTVIGTVKLWGTVVESERGWRASNAYPEQLWLPCAEQGRAWAPPGIRRGAERMARALASTYGVPVHVIEVPSTPNGFPLREALLERLAESAALV